jgi:hypothetical protein
MSTIPAFAGAYMLALQHIMPYAYTPVVLIALSGILIMIGALMGPETRDVELGAPDLAVNRHASGTSAKVSPTP